MLQLRNFLNYLKYPIRPLLSVRQFNENQLHITFLQGYDNAVTMDGIHGGVQMKIRDISPKAIFRPCLYYLLNLCGVHTFSSAFSSTNFS